MQKVFSLKKFAPAKRAIFFSKFSSLRGKTVPLNGTDGGVAVSGDGVDVGGLMRVMGHGLQENVKRKDDDGRCCALTQTAYVMFVSRPMSSRMKVRMVAMVEAVAPGTVLGSFVH